MATNLSDCIKTLQPAICKSCNRQILWVKMPSGKSMPLDPDPQTVVVMDLLEGGPHVTRQAYTSHFATCPYANKHRKKKTGAHIHKNPEVAKACEICNPPKKCPSCNDKGYIPHPNGEAVCRDCLPSASVLDR